MRIASENVTPVSFQPRLVQHFVLSVQRGLHFQVLNEMRLLISYLKPVVVQGSHSGLS